MEDLTGKQFGHYQIVAPLGEGGMAAVYKAYQPSMERYVAVKVLPRHMSASEEFVQRFRREAKLLAQLQHPHILPVFDYGEAEGYPYIVMPFIQSGTLAELIQNKSLPLSEVRRIMIQVGKALSYAHTRGMIHRDIKPSNVLIDEAGNCLLTDFGLARMVEASTKITASDTIMGTPAYMSPEQGAGSNVDQRSDLYSLGIILYEMVTGRVPYTAETPVAVVFKHIQDPLPSARKLNPDLPESVELVLLKALAKSPDDRYQTADELVRAIQKAIPETDAVEKTIAPESTPSISRPSINDHGPRQPLPTSKTTDFAKSKTNRLPVWGIAAFGVVAVIGILTLAGIAFFGAKLFQTPAATTVATEVVAPTDSLAPVATSTEQPTSIPATEAPVPDAMLSQFFTDYQVVSNNTFDDPSGNGWNVQSGKIENGIMEIIGNDNNDGAWFAQEIQESNAILLDFNFVEQSTFLVYINYGSYGTAQFRRFGMFVENGSPITDIYEGDQYIWKGFTGDLAVKAGKPYRIMLAILPQGELLEVVWDPENPGNTLEYRNQYDNTWSGLPWTLVIQASKGTVQFDNFQVVRFSGVK